MVRTEYYVEQKCSIVYTDGEWQLEVYRQSGGEGWIGVSQDLGDVSRDVAIQIVSYMSSGEERLVCDECEFELEIGMERAREREGDREKAREQDRERERQREGERQALVIVMSRVLLRYITSPMFYTLHSVLQCITVQCITVQCTSSIVRRTVNVRILYAIHCTFIHCTVYIVRCTT